MTAMSIATSTGVPPAQPPRTPNAVRRSVNAKAARRKWAAAIAQLVVVVVLLAPIIWMYVAAFRPDLDIRSGRLLPRSLTFGNFTALFQYDVVKTAFINSVLVAAAVSVVTTCAAIAAAYAITRLRFRGRGPTMALVLTAQLVPGLVVLVPLVVVMRQLGLSDSLVGLGIAHLTLGLPIAVMLLRNYLADIPKSLEEAAMIDGCSVLGALWRVILPLLKPAIVAVTAFSFILSWGEYLLALSLISSDDQKTLPLAMQSLFQLNTVDLGVVMAFGVLISFPVALLFMVIQRNLVSNLAMGGVKE